MAWALLSPWWLLAGAPLAVLVFLLLRRSDRPRPTPWAFLLRPEDRAPDWRRRRLGRLFLPFLLLLGAVACLLLVPARPARARDSVVLLREPEVFRALDVAQRAAWADALAAWARRRDLDSLVLEAEGRTTRLAPSGLASFRLPEPAAVPAPRRDGPPPLLVCGLDAGAYPESDFLPWPVPADSWAILEVGLLDDGRHQVRVRRWDAAPRPGLRLLQDGRPLDVGAGFPEDDTVVVVDIDVNRRDELSLSPGDGRPWTDRAAWMDPDRRKLEWRADTAVPAGLRRVLDGTRVGWTGPLLVTSDPGRFAAHGGPAWLLCPERSRPGMVELQPVPPDCPYRVISHAALPFAGRRTLFDLPLSRLPAFHLAGEPGVVLLSHAGRPVAARTAPGRLVQTLPFDAVRHDDPAGEQDLARLLLAGLGLADPERPVPCFAYHPPKEGAARLTAGASPAARDRDVPLALPGLFLLAAVVLFSSGLWLLGRDRIMRREAAT